MPEIPDLNTYRQALADRIEGAILREIRIISPFVLRTVQPGPDALADHVVVRVHRLGKRLAIDLEADLHIVIHLMIAGRLRWYPGGGKVQLRPALAAFEFDTGTLVLTEAGRKHRAAIHLLGSEAAMLDMHPGGLEVQEVSFDAFHARVSSENHTLKRALTDQRLLAGIGNAYSDEILHRARLSPMRQTRQLDETEWRRLYESARAILDEWSLRLTEKCGDGFPEKVTAFQPEMAVHGKYREPCPDCGKPVQRIRYATNECNYCAQCQNQGNILADRALSRLLKKDWPRTLEELDER